MIHVPSGRVYIGQRKLPKGKTPEVDYYTGSGKIWKHIYNKHKDECVKVIIDYANTKAEIDELEKKYITHYKNVYGEFCVNIADGGEGGPGWRINGIPSMLGKHHSKESKAKMSAAHTGKVFSKESKAKMSETRTGKLNHNFGKHFSEEHRAKISASCKATKAKNRNKKMNLIK